MRDVAAQRGQRRAQLVRGVREKPALRVARALEAVQHRVERRREPADLVRSMRIGEAPARVPRPPDLAGGSIESRERLQGAAHQQRGRAGADSGCEQRSEERQSMQRRDRVREICGGRRDEDRAAARDVGDRSGVDTELVAAEAHRAVPRPRALDRALRERTRQHAATKRE